MNISNLRACGDFSPAIWPNYPREAASAPILKRSDGNRLKVLVIESDLVKLRQYQTKLSQWPMALDIAYAGDTIDAALEIQRVQPDLVILDLDLPGFERQKVSKQDIWHAGMSIMVATGPLRWRAPGCNRQLGMAIVVVVSLNEKQINALRGIPPGVRVLPRPIHFERLMAIAQKTAVRRGLGESTVAV